MLSMLYRAPPILETKHGTDTIDRYIQASGTLDLGLLVGNFQKSW